MKIAIYARVSTSDKGQDVETQLNVLRTWAMSLGYDEILEYQDVGISGASSNRPQFIKMRADARQNLFKGILIRSLDRFSREGISNTLAYIEDLKKFNIFLRSYQESWLDTSDEGMGKLLLAIMSWTASFERQRISERIKAGIAQRRGLGTWRGGRPKGSTNCKVCSHLKKQHQHGKYKCMKCQCEEYKNTPPLTVGTKT